MRVVVFGPDAPASRRIPSAGVEGDPPTLPPGTRVQVIPDPVYLLPGERQDLRVLGLLPDRTALEGIPVRWSSTDPRIAGVDNGGAVVGRNQGHGAIIASVNAAAADTVSVVVRDADFRLTGPRLVLALEAFDTATVVVPSQGNRRLLDGLNWRVADPSMARVGPTGTVQALRPGTTELVVQGFLREQRIPLVVHRPVSHLTLVPSPGPEPLVVPLMGTRPIHVAASSVDSTPVPEAELRWEVGDPAIVTFDAESGIVHGRREGITSLTLRADGFDPIAWAIRVEPTPLLMDPVKLVIEPSRKDTLSASFIDLAGVPIGPAAALTWTSSAPNVVRVDSTGVVTGLQEGRATIQARTSWGDAVSSEVHVVADLLLVIDRGKAGSGIVQVRSHDPSRMTQVLRDGARNRDPVFAPDRSTIAFASDRSGDFDIYVMDTDGASSRALTATPGDQTHPSWTPDGRYLVFADQRTGQSHIAITTITPPTIRALASAPSGVRFSRPAVSPDGTTIAFLASQSTQTDVAVIDRMGGPVRIVARNVSPQAGPVFQPSGELLYARWAADESRGGIFRLDLHTGESTVIHSVTQPPTSLAVSRDGTRLAYVSSARLWHISFKKGDAAQLALPLFERVTDPSF
ncbi:MAG: hypothetical protein HKM89_08455 [Gemmatimonadales bacterium]|nr:hypothetical protein [Gemmatimonadales bacterium]